MLRACAASVRERVPVDALCNVVSGGTESLKPVAKGATAKWEGVKSADQQSGQTRYAAQVHSNTRGIMAPLGTVYTLGSTTIHTRRRTLRRPLLRTLGL